MNNQDYAPFFCEGLLFLPSKTVELLIKAGLDPRIGEAALHGLTLDDHKALIGEISDKLVALLGTISEDSRAYQQLNSDLTHFMLSGKPA
jgi:hypothetical protein